ncbi:MAG: hypothetical protein KGJ59_10865 [Bacteroidota bacterium]|nr:hypothetical protein [Bacteroidota bacterium]
MLFTTVISASLRRESIFETAVKEWIPAGVYPDASGAGMTQSSYGSLYNSFLFS